MKQNKNGNLARMGLRIALMVMLGQKATEAFYARREKNQHSRGGDTRRQDHDSPAGFKLIKKMHRQPRQPGKDPAIFARKVRRHIVNQARKASKDFQAEREARLRYVIEQ